MSKTKGQLPSKSYRYQLYLGKDADGKRKYKSFTADSMRKAKKAASIWLAEHPIRPSSDPTFCEAAYNFLKSRSNTLSGSTYQDYEHRIKYLCDLFPMFAKSRMSVIDSETVQQIVNDLTRTKKPCRKKKPTEDDLSAMAYMSPKTVQNYYSLIRSVLRTQGRITLRDIKLPAIPVIDLNIPENEDIKKLLSAIKGTELEIPILLAVIGPMRRGEIYGLDVHHDIDFEKHSVRVHRVRILCSGNVYRIKETPKSAAGNRTIIYPAYVTDLIKSKGYITKLSMTYIYKKYRSVLDAAGLGKYRFHDLRHYSASFQIALGVLPQYVMDRGGWETEASMKRYIHAMDKKRKELSEKTNSAFGDLLP